MIRSLIRLTAAIAFVCLLPGFGHAAAPSGLQYDEIVRVVLGSATPPPPGNFAADVAALESPTPVAAAPRHHGFGNLGSIAGNLIAGNVTGAATDAASGAAADALADRLLAPMLGSFAGALRGLTQGRLERHSFYAGWERVDDVAGQTATITKCDLHEIIRLDLAKKTYTITDPTASSAPAATPQPAKHERRGDATTPLPERPGTAVATVSNVVTPLGSRTLDGLDATGYDTASTFAMSQATGSCRDGSFGFKTRTYYARFPAPRLVCPLPAAAAAVPRERYPREPANFVASGGCRPTFALHAAGPVPPARNLALYQTMATVASAGSATPDPAATPAGGFVFLTERGNVHTLSAANAGLFDPPADFTKAP